MKKYAYLATGILTSIVALDIYGWILYRKAKKIQPNLPFPRSFKEGRVMGKYYVSTLKQK